MRPAHALSSVLAVIFLFACSTAEEQQESAPPEATYLMDPHSHARPNEAVITHLDLDIRVDMDNRRIEGVAAYKLQAPHADQVVFDTDGPEVTRVQDASGKDLEFTVGEETGFGRALTVRLPAGCDSVRIHYRTGAETAALQWLGPRQTAGGKSPFLYTQGQAILTRTWIPIQDSPGIRITYNARVQVPAGLMAVMSASNPRERSADGLYSFRMEQPIPAYLIALAVGDFTFQELGPRTGVYAEPVTLEKAAWEFADMERMLTEAEELYGPYRWERYDVIVLPPSFPYGGMENPRITFATPTIIAGDRSLTALIAHELAHSWSGNLVTNATWDDFWLNEGFTVYFEKRISERIFGEEYARMLDQLGYQDLLHTVEKIDAGVHPEDTRLKLSLAGRDPDEGTSEIAYEKGYAFLRVLEEKVGRAKFDAFLRRYFETFAFQSMTTERFLTYLDEQLLKPEGVVVDVQQWVYSPGLPKDLIIPAAEGFVLVDEQLVRLKNGTPAKQLNTKDWVTFQWIHFVRHLPKPLSPAMMKDLDAAFGFTATGNMEVLAAWLEQCVAYNYAPAKPRLKEFLTTVGRRKFLTPLYEGLMATPEGKETARVIYAEARPLYHAVAVKRIDEVLGWKGSDPVMF
ncbi:MAG: M1 family metallopeptidase [Flavobacteriales bacterium]|nr:M1 family metallopeptidase [Flavobacteriales bacterium]